MQNKTPESFNVYEVPAGAKTVPAWAIAGVVLVGVTGLGMFLHLVVHGVCSLHQAVIGGFLALNLLVNFWELGLFFQGDAIRQEYLENRERFAGRPLDRVTEAFNKPVPLNTLYQFRWWTGVWSSYCHFDPGYSRRGSFGYNGDVGNGFSTLIPGFLFALCMTFPIFPARAMGIVGLAIFWQMFYGTAVYFFQFFHAGRHHGHRFFDLLIFVGASNGMWFIFAPWGLLASIWMIYNDSYALFTDPANTSIWGF